MTYKPFLNEETRSSVLAGVRAGTEAAWGRFFDLYAGYVFSLARRAGFIGADADDLVQTVFAGLAAPGGFDGYERGKGSFRSWLRRRVQWRIADEFRRREAVPPFDSGGAKTLDRLPAPPTEPVDADWLESARAEALRRLKDPLRRSISPSFRQAPSKNCRPRTSFASTASRGTTSIRFASA